MLDLSQLPNLNYCGNPALPPQKEDLERLYRLITENRCTTVLEFGCGYSTFVIDQALKDNKKWFDSLENKIKIRNKYAFLGVSVDNQVDWLYHVYDKSFTTMKPKHCDCVIGLMNHRYVTAYVDLPQIIPDFIYIDGPDPATVWGFDMPISMDLIGYENVLIPGTIVLIDGRTNNARFLERNLQRNWKVEWNKEEDYTLMTLDEPRLGKINVIGRDILDALNEAGNK